MNTCPRCNSRTLEHCSDAHGEFSECFMCGHVIEPTPAPEYTPWNPRREYLDPVITAGKIAWTKRSRWRDQDKRREYDRNYKAWKRVARP